MKISVVFSVISDIDFLLNSIVLLTSITLMLKIFSGHCWTGSCDLKKNRVTTNQVFARGLLMHVVFTFSACAVLESKRMVMKLAKIFHFFGKKMSASRFPVNL